MNQIRDPVAQRRQRGLLYRGVSLATGLTILLLCFGHFVGVDRLALEHHVGHRRSDEDGAERTEDHTEDHGEGEAADTLTTQEEDAEQHDERRG